MISKNSVVTSAYKEQTMENVSPEHTQDSQEQVPDGFSPLSGKIGDVKNDSKTNRGDSSIVTQGAAVVLERRPFSKEIRIEKGLGKNEPLKLKTIISRAQEDHERSRGQTLDQKS